MFPGDGLPNGKVPVFAPSYNGNGSSSPRRPDLPVFAQNGNTNGNANGQAGRRNSEINSLAQVETSGSTSSNSNGMSPRVSNVSRRSRRSVSLESDRRQTFMGYPARTNGTVSPLTVRSSSPVGWRSGAVSPIAVRSSSPAGQHYRNSPLSNGAPSTNGAMTPQQQALAAQKAAARRSVAGLTLDTQVNGNVPRPPQPVDRPTSSNTEEDGEAMDEVISLSPAVRAPVMKFRRQSSGLSLGEMMAGTPHPGRDPGNTLDTVMESGGRKPYFGQAVNAEDLVAVNLENAFDLL